MRRILLSCALLAAASLTATAHADSISYNLTLYQQSGSNSAQNGLAVGSGSFTVVGPSATTGNNTYVAIDQNHKTPADYISSLTFLIDGVSFDLANASSNPGNPDPTKSVNSTQIQFNNSALAQLLYTGSESVNNVTITFNGNGGLNYAFNDGNVHSNGYLVGSLATAPNPEPSALILFGTGAAGLAGFVRRRLAA